MYLDGRVHATKNSEAGEGPLRRTRGMVLTTKNPYTQNLKFFNISKTARKIFVKIGMRL